jgi:hypothetical protein
MLESATASLVATASAVATALVSAVPLLPIGTPSSAAVPSRHGSHAPQQQSIRRSTPKPQLQLSFLSPPPSPPNSPPDSPPPSSPAPSSAPPDPSLPSPPPRAFMEGWPTPVASAFTHVVASRDHASVAVHNRIRTMGGRKASVNEKPRDIADLSMFHTWAADVLRTISSVQVAAGSEAVVTVYAHRLHNARVVLARRASEDVSQTSTSVYIKWLEPSSLAELHGPRAPSDLWFENGDRQTSPDGSFAITICNSSPESVSLEAFSAVGLAYATCVPPPAVMEGWPASVASAFTHVVASHDRACVAVHDRVRTMVGSGTGLAYAPRFNRPRTAAPSQTDAPPPPPPPPPRTPLTSLYTHRAI